MTLPDWVNSFSQIKTTVANWTYIESDNLSQIIQNEDQEKPSKKIITNP